VELLQQIEQEKKRLSLCIDRRLTATTTIDALKRDVVQSIALSTLTADRVAIVCPLPTSNDELFTLLVGFLESVEALYSRKVAAYQQSIVLMEKQAASATDL
jgi:hypothetical protein